MNDAFVGLFIIAAYTLFAAIWTGFWRSRWAFWLAMPVIGLLLGLALASKWVAAYAIGALILLILVRSALGRVLAIGGLIAITAVLGYMAISVPEGSATPFGNVTFLLIMIGLTIVAVLASVLHPVAWSDEEFRLAVLGPAGLGTLVFFGGPRDGTAGNRVRARPDPRASAGPRDRPRLRLTRRVRPVLARAAVRLRAVGRAAGTGRPGTLPRAAGVTARRLAAPGLVVRHPDRVGRREPPRAAGGRLRHLVPAVGRARRLPDRGGLAARAHGPDPARADRPDVPLPQRAHVGPRRVVAVVGVAVRPQAGLVLPGRLR